MAAVKEVRKVYAIIATGGKQYRVSEGDVIRVEKLGGEAGDSVVFEDVLAIGGDNLIVGDEVSQAKVSGEIVEQGRAKKVIVYKYKRKSGYHKKNGHRQSYTKVKISGISAS